MRETEQGFAEGKLARITEILFAKGVNPVTQECLELFLQNKLDQSILQLIADRCRAIAAGHYKKLCFDQQNMEIISRIILATFIACPDGQTKKFWLKIMTAPLIENQSESKQAESYIFGTVIGILQSINQFATDPTPQNDYVLVEQTFIELLGDIITKPSNLLWVKLPGDREQKIINKELKEYIRRRYSHSPKNDFIQLLLQRINNNLPADTDPWSVNGRLQNYHFSKSLLEKLLFSIFGAQTIMHQLELFTQRKINQAIQDGSAIVITDLAEVIKPDDNFPYSLADARQHYDLGIAYKEMGLMDEAISEFQTAGKVYRDDSLKADCILMISICYKEKNNLDTAIQILIQMDELNLDNKEKSAQYFLQAEIYLQQGDLERARKSAWICKGFDADFPDLSNLIANIDQAFDSLVIK